MCKVELVVTIRGPLVVTIRGPLVVTTKGSCGDCLWGTLVEGPQVGPTGALWGGPVGPF